MLFVEEECKQCWTVDTRRLNQFAFLWSLSGYRQIPMHDQAFANQGMVSVTDNKQLLVSLLSYEVKAKK